MSRFLNLARRLRVNHAHNPLRDHFTPRHRACPSTFRTFFSSPNKSNEDESTASLPTEAAPIAAAPIADKLQIERILDGQSVRFGIGAIANLARSSVVGTAGQTLILSTVATAPLEQGYGSLSTPLTDALRAADTSNGAPLTISYQERHHGVGKIPTLNRQRRDTMHSSDDEILAGRAIDRALRPLIQKKLAVAQIHVSCAVQAHDGRGNPAALALNAASVALGDDFLSERVAAVHLCLDGTDGTVILDPTHAQVQTSVAELFYAGTRDKVVMMEAASPTACIPEDVLLNLMKVAHGAIQPILDTQETALEMGNDQMEPPSDEDLLASLGLGASLEEQNTPAKTADCANDFEDKVSAMQEEAYKFCQERFGDAALRLFGYEEGMGDQIRAEGAYIHPSGKPLLSKSIRGRREHLLSKEIQRVLREDFKPSDPALQAAYQDELGGVVVSLLSNAVHKKLVQNALFVSSSKYQTRGDNRGSNGSGTVTIRPLTITVPALPDAVHGSSLFSRGDTQVLCTTTLGAPRDGVPLTNPYHDEINIKAPESGPFDHLPVGSLRYLRSQEALISDLNSKKVKADKEMTGESGTLDEVRRFFLHYDFPSFSKGDVPSGRGNRREVGHGRLAEKALESAIPSPSEFPYAMRVTSEVTGSNGSSSMASVCGATLALLDAGVPLVAPVAGVSVGLALGDSLTEYSLLLDITGTEDHYGCIDFKIAGSEEGVTALQLDVKTPLPMEILAEALQLAKIGRLAILDEMKTLTNESSASIVSKLLPRLALKDSAPRVEVVRFDPLRKRDLIGPGGAVLRQLEERFGVSLDLTQEGQCLLFGQDRVMVAKAKSAVMDLVADVEEGQVYEGTIIEIKDFGAIVELLRNKEGLLHVSEITEDMSHPEGNYGVVHQNLKVGQKIEVLCTGVDPVQGSIRLSRKALLQLQREELQKRLD